MSEEKYFIKDRSMRRMVWFKLSVGALKVGIATYVGGVAANTWTQMNADAHILLILMMILSVVTYIDGFIDQTVSRIAKGKLPLGPEEDAGKTQMWEKKEKPNEKPPITTVS